MPSFDRKSYGRVQEVLEIYQMFRAGRDVSMFGPRRLGKTFVLDRMVERAAGFGFRAVKVELAGATSATAGCREFCEKIGRATGALRKGAMLLKQRATQAATPRSISSGEWYAPLVGLDHLSHFESLISELNSDGKPWAILIDELPIFLKAMHDSSPDGLRDARDFMNFFSRIRADYPKVRWLITGSIGAEPLARQGNYLGALVKFQAYVLDPLDCAQAQDYLIDLAHEGQLRHRNRMTRVEAEQIVEATGWLAPFYLDAVAQKLRGAPTDDREAARMLVDEAVQRLLSPTETTAFGTWEEHLRKHYSPTEQAVAFAVLAALSPSPAGLGIDALLGRLGRSDLKRASLSRLLDRLDVDGFIASTPDAAVMLFRNPLLRRWWQRFQPDVD